MTKYVFPHTSIYPYCASATVDFWNHCGKRWNCSRWDLFSPFKVLTFSEIRVYTISEPLQQTTFEIIVAKGEIANIEQLLHFPQQFQLFSIILLSFIDIIYVLYLMISKSVRLNIIEIIVAKGEIAHNEQSWFAFTTIILNTFQLSYYHFTDFL